MCVLNGGKGEHSDSEGKNEREREREREREKVKEEQRIWIGWSGWRTAIFYNFFPRRKQFRGKKGVEKNVVV